MGADIDLGECQCCGREPAVGVGSVPGVPMSIAWGRKCLEAGATPLWAADSTVAQCCNPAAPSWSDLAEWFREQVVYLDGQYVRVDTLGLETVDCPHDHAQLPAGCVEGDSCLGCIHGKVVGIMEARRHKEAPQ